MFLATTFAAVAVSLAALASGGCWADSLAELRTEAIDTAIMSNTGAIPSSWKIAATPALSSTGALTFLSSDNRPDELDEAVRKLSGPFGCHPAWLPLPDASKMAVRLRASDIGTLFRVDSWRYRNAKGDPAYRVRNIAKAYLNMGGDRYSRVMNPGESVRYGAVIGKLGQYENGEAIVEDKIKVVQGGGLCGGATGLYQGILGNLNVAVERRSPHTFYYRSLYDSVIDGKVHSGLDATYWEGGKDLVIRNSSQFPIILVNRLEYRHEQNFTLSYFRADRAKSELSKAWTPKAGCFAVDATGRGRINSCYKKVER